MEMFERIAGQMDAVRLPLFAVTLAALPRANTPALLMLHWHGFGEGSPVPASALQVNEGWGGLAALDQAMLDAAWQLGAWQLEREERRACGTAGAAEQEAVECRRAFGDLPGGEEALLAEAPDRSDMLALAARVGYIRWHFRPVRGGVWRDSAQDDSLAADGGRPPPCPVPPKAAVGTRSNARASDAPVSRTLYRLGRLSRLIIP
jgi:hypothetical protein